MGSTRQLCGAPSCFWARCTAFLREVRRTGTNPDVGSKAEKRPWSSCTVEKEIVAQTGDQRDVSRDLIIVHYKTADHVLIDVGAVGTYTGDLRQSPSRAKAYRQSDQSRKHQSRCRQVICDSELRPVKCKDAASSHNGVVRVVVQVIETKSKSVLPASPTDFIRDLITRCNATSCPILKAEIREASWSETRRR